MQFKSINQLRFNARIHNCIRTEQKGKHLGIELGNHYKFLNGKLPSIRDSNKAIGGIFGDIKAEKLIASFFIVLFPRRILLLKHTNTYNKSLH